MRLDLRRLVTRPRTLALPDSETDDAFTREECGAHVFNDRQTFEVLSAFLRAHGTPTGTTTILHNSMLTQSTGSRRKGSRAP